MPNPISRPSLTITLEQRYDTTPVGEAFNVQKILSAPGVTPPQGKTIDATSQNGATFQSPNGFLVKPLAQVSQLIVVQSGDSKGLSTYVKGLDTTPYHR